MIDNMLTETRNIYREIEMLEEKINNIYIKAKKNIENKKYDDDYEKQDDLNSLECIESYVTNFNI